VDEATDVLTFPAGDFPSGNLADAPLGDIVISVDFAQRQAVARGVALGQELAFLAIHGALHLAGYNDETDRAREEMVAEMNRVARAAGLEPDAAWHSILHAENEDK
jgi:rRNA maturation RNase YbeY